MEDLGLLSWSSELRSYCPSHPPGHIAFVAKLPKYMLKCVPWMRKYSKIILKLNLFFSYQSKLMSQGVLNIVWSKHRPPNDLHFLSFDFQRIIYKSNFDLLPNGRRLFFFLTFLKLYVISFQC